MSASYEIGKIRPPSEAHSLLVRVNRNCPWNRCTFCPVYKGERFSPRPVDQILDDIRAQARKVAQIKTRAQKEGSGLVDRFFLDKLARQDPDATQLGLFLLLGGRSAFLQDADGLVMPPRKLMIVLEELQKRFPNLERITSYSRAATVARRRLEDLKSFRKMGLNRLHVGLESGSDLVLAETCKGATADQLIAAGKKIKKASIELSLYIMPGLGGARLSREHTSETARVLNAINPDFIRLRSLAIPPDSPLDRRRMSGEFQPLDEIETVREIREIISQLDQITSTITSDHVLNLLEEVRGVMPEDKPRLLDYLDSFLSLDRDRMELFLIGRRLGQVRGLSDIEDRGLELNLRRARDRLKEAFGADVQVAMEQLKRRFI